MGFDLEIVAPDRLVISEEADKVVCPGDMGEFGVLPGHVPFFTRLKIGEIRFIDSATKSDHYIVVTGGYVEVSGKKITILADECIRSRDVDKVKTELDISAAKEILNIAEKDSPEYLKAKKDHDYSRAILKMYNKLS